MTEKRGNLSIHSENIFPIIKKWLYSDHDIFLREMVSNATDAITKLKKLRLAGEFTPEEGEKFAIRIAVSPKEKSIRISDNGIGMTAQEVEKYINQIAFSGARDFIEKYKDKANEEQIIGHFGLGFYSAFMVADKVAIDTLSYGAGEEPVHWESEGGLEYAMSAGDRRERGTTITLYLNENCYEFANEFRVREVLNKYCAFMPEEIFLRDTDGEEAVEIIDKEEVKEGDTVLETILEPAKTEEKTGEDGTKETVEIEPAREKVKIKKRPVAVNDTHPLWTRHPNECTDEEYKAFYRKVFQDYKEPLFWIHLNMDYPFHLQGILYFPKINTEYDSLEGTIKLYNNQVFIADNIKEVIPEFLMLLKGVIDSADIPLNVSRSALQNDGSVKKISEYMAKKVADKLSGLCKTDRENYEKYWDDLAPFIKYGYLRDEKFAGKIEDYILFKDIYEKYETLKELTNREKEASQPEKGEEDAPADASVKEEREDKKTKTKIFYVTDVKEQSQYISMFKENQKNAVVMPHTIDTPFIAAVESKHDNLQFLRIDADVTEEMAEETGEETKKQREDLAAKVKETLALPSLQVTVMPLKNSDIASVITVSEESRRMQEMMKQYGMMGMDPAMFGGNQETLVLNASHPLVELLMKEPEHKSWREIAQQLYDLASLAHGSLSPERMAAFIRRTNEIMALL